MANKIMHHVVIGSDTFEIVDQYAREHGVTIDSTLTQSGQAADAKAVGDALGDLTYTLSKVIPFTINNNKHIENGSLINGTVSNNLRASTDVIDVFADVIYVVPQYGYTIDVGARKNETWYSVETFTDATEIDLSEYDAFYIRAISTRSITYTDDALVYLKVVDEIVNVSNNVGELIPLVDDLCDGLSEDENNLTLWEVGGIGSGGEKNNTRTTSIRLKIGLVLDDYFKIITSNSLTTGYLALYTDASSNNFVTRIAISSNTEYEIADLIKSYPTAKRFKIEIGEVGGSLANYDNVVLLKIAQTPAEFAKKQNRQCNNLIGDVFERLYPVNGLTYGTVLTFSTSDGKPIGGSQQTNIGFYNAKKQFMHKFGFPPSHSSRTITLNTEDYSNTKYIAILDGEPRVPIMINIGDTAMPYEEYFQPITSLTKQTNDLSDILEKSGKEAEIKNLISQSKYVYSATDSEVGTEKVLTLMHISDMHGNRAGMDYALELYDKYSDSIDDIIHTGDTVTKNLSDGITNWINSGCAEKVLNVIGNHDTEENLVLQAAGKDNVYNTIFAPYISGWNVTQPADVDDSTSGDYHALYYYKDYAEAKVRLIVCDTNFWDNAQKTWLTGTLAGAKTLEYAVVLACHDVKKLTELTTANFSSYNGDGINEGNSYANQPDDWLDPVKDFMDDGGHFVCILAGHNHNGHMGYMTYYPDIFVYVAQKSSMDRVSGTARILGESNQNTVSIVTINPTEKLFKLFSIGAQVDGHLRQRHVFCYNYETKTIISQW